MTVCGAVAHFLDERSVCDRPPGHLGSHADHHYGDGDRVYWWAPHGPSDWPTVLERERARDLEHLRRSYIYWYPGHLTEHGFAAGLPL